MTRNVLELEGDGFDGRRVQATMLYPESERSRSVCVAHQVIRDVAARGGDGHVLIPVNMLSALLMAPPWSELRADVTARTKAGMAAGRQLAFLYLMDKFGVTEPSRRKSIYLSQAYAGTSKWGTGDRMNASEGDTKAVWRKYKSVSHFWAAQLLNKHYPFAGERTIFGEGLEPFLAVSKGVLEWAKAFVPHRADKPILESGEVWNLPDSVISRHLKSDRPPDRLFALLASYKAPKHSKYD